MSIIFVISGAIFVRGWYILTKTKMWRKTMEERERTNAEKLVEWALENVIAFLAVGFCFFYAIKSLFDQLLLASL